MAKKKRRSNGVNMSEQIRNAWDADRSLKPAAITEQLSAKGIATSTSLVSNILSQYRKKLGLKGRKRRKRKQEGEAVGNARRDASANGASIGSVIEAFKLVGRAKELVGAEGLRAIVKAI